MNTQTAHMIATLTRAGIEYDDALALRRVAMTLHRWHELECGTDGGCIERDEDTGLTYWRSASSARRYRTPDRETGALKRLAAIMGNIRPCPLMCRATRAARPCTSCGPVTCRKAALPSATTRAGWLCTSNSPARRHGVGGP